MFLRAPDQNALPIAIAIAHIVALIPHEAMAGPITQVITTGQVADDAQSFFVKLPIDEVIARIERATGSQTLN